MKQIEQNGLTFTVERVKDTNAGLPWQELDSHGIVSGWTHRAKKPCERILHIEDCLYRYYDLQASKAKAIAQAWSIADPEGLSKKQVIAKAIEQDFACLKGFCNDEWYYIGLVVTCLETGQKASLWSIESNSSESYFKEIEQELIQELIQAMPAYLKKETEKLEKLKALVPHGTT